MKPMWDIEMTSEFERWVEDLSDDEQNFVDAAIEKLEEYGPALPRPLADTVNGSRHRNMKELRPVGCNIRVFFAFDPRRVGMLLIGGDKTGRWKKFHTETIPVADELYDDHLENLEKERRDRR